MPKFTADDFKKYLKLNAPTKGEIAEKLYGNLTYDIALPNGFISEMVEFNHTVPEITLSFVWIYPPGSTFGEPAPLTLKACDWLKQYQIKKEVMP